MHLLFVNVENQAKVMYKIREADCYGNRSKYMKILLMCLETTFPNIILLLFLVIRECPRCLTLPDIHKVIKATVACNSTGKYNYVLKLWFC